MLSVTVMVFTTHPLSVIPLNIKQLNIFPVPSLLWRRTYSSPCCCSLRIRIWLRIWTPPPPPCCRPCCRRGKEETTKVASYTLTHFAVCERIPA